MKQDGRWGGLIAGAPALTTVQNRIIKTGLAAIGTAAITTSHGIRGGVASDNTDLPDAVLTAPNLAVGSTLNHTSGQMKLTKQYVGAMGIDHFDARLDQRSSRSLKHHFSSIPNAILEPYRKQILSKNEITQWIESHPEFVEANEKAAPNWVRRKAADNIHREKLAAHEEQQLRNKKSNPSRYRKLTLSQVNSVLFLLTLISTRRSRRELLTSKLESTSATYYGK
jgi:hypothetical protein